MNTVEDTLSGTHIEHQMDKSDKSKPVVLLVDDDRGIRRLCEDILEDEFDLVSFGDGSEAKDYIASSTRHSDAKRHYDVAIFDHNLGISKTGEDISGEDLSALSRVLHPKSAIIRASGSFADFYSSETPTGDFFLAKPFKSTAEVLSMVRCASALSSMLKSSC